MLRFGLFAKIQKNQKYSSKIKRYELTQRELDNIKGEKKMNKLKCPNCGSKMKLDYAKLLVCECGFVTDDEIQQLYQARLDKVLSKFENNYFYKLGGDVIMLYQDEEFALILDGYNPNYVVISLKTVESLLEDLEKE